MKKRWICLFVENEIGVLKKVSGLFSGKCYHLNSLTIGITEDKTISRMTISLSSDDKTFEQVKKQLNRSIEVIKVVDYTDIAVLRKEIMFIKISRCTSKDMEEILRIAQVFCLCLVDYNQTTAILESVQTEERNQDLAVMIENVFTSRVEIVRGGSVGIERVSMRLNDHTCI